MSNKKSKYILLGTLSAVIVASVLVFYLSDKKIKQNAESSKINVEKGIVIVTESKDISILENQAQIPSDEIAADEYTDKEEEKLYFIEGDFLIDDTVSKEEKKAMEINTKYLQMLVDNAKEEQIIL